MSLQLVIFGRLGQGIPVLRANEPPLEPDEDTARNWLIEELAKPEYQNAKPNPIDVFFNKLWDWIASLFTVDGSGAFGINPVWIFVILGIVAVVIVVAIFGRPKAIARRRAANQSVFLEDDNRSVTELRAAADAAARAEDWALATTERFRAISRSLSDRTLISMRPGTTAQGVAQAAATPFPDELRALRQAANAFDAVRYLERGANADTYASVRDLDLRIETARPATLIPVETVVR
ncbi:DUF4129 domain-containing protein [Gulosibacter chungangensis]|uniref:DUF4129 domain-containing protein n=1 Tax=Gulosibacter chungangensis TaxID=979746 RepID=A0A7J5B7V9_9MICO|nr:DUF4129 domain-containing protein [Gulosibacter chungangensis]KAB1641167.1 DUF4129 domain-containing protein [Gulosibacter chungangensis]